MKSIAIEYFNAFENKDVATIRGMFDSNVTLRDWDIEAKGIESVVAATTKIFHSTDTILVRVLNVIQDQNLVAGELNITINNRDTIRVVDIIEFNSIGKICAIRAYKG